MSTPTAGRVVNVGIDFGSTGLRVAFAVAGEPSRHARVPGPALSLAVPWLLPEQTGNRVTFPSLKHRLGTDSRASVDAPSLVSQLLREVRLWIETESRARTGRVVITVPARYSSSQREALRDAARAAGFGQTQLIGDSVAAVIAERDRGAGDGTYLVFGMGYAGFEVGLVRAVGPHYRVLGYEFGTAPGGSSLDQCVIDGLISTLAPLELDLSVWQARDWLRIHAAAERVKLRLDTESAVVLPIALVGPAGAEGVSIGFNVAAFAELVRSHAEEMAGRIQELLGRCRLEPSDVDSWLLVGGSTGLTQFRTVLPNRFGAKATVTGPEHLARGALLFIDRAAGAAGHDEAAAEPIEDAPRLSTRPPALTGTVISPPPQRQDRDRELLTLPDTRARPPDSELSQAKWLADNGRRREAATLLRNLVQQAQAMLAELADKDGALAPDEQRAAQARSRRALEEARAMLTEGHHERAVAMSHNAWSTAPESADAFEGMIEVHCRAAEAKDTVEGYTDAMRWLRCAYNHDQSNTRVRDLLAKRAFNHARQSHRLGRRAEATQAVKECLTWDPEHRGATSLLQRLDRGGDGTIR